jgi:RpiB/LacA/LacB family sugar-phosphate isomerase
MKKINISIASDHAAFDLKDFLIKKLRNLSNIKKINDHGFNKSKKNNNQLVDYPDYAKKTIKDIIKENFDFGILICKTGIGMNIIANRKKGIRAAIIYNKKVAFYSRQHNNANIICLGSKFFSKKTCFDLIKIFVNTPFSFKERHIRRINKIDK